MAHTRSYWVYMLASRTCTRYIGVTNDLERRVLEHKEGQVPGFTPRYSVNRLVHFEGFGDVTGAIGREKELKGWRRRRKVELIESVNPQWRDLSEGWYD
jgi:putative endonuclease